MPGIKDRYRFHSARWAAVAGLCIAAVSTQLHGGAVVPPGFEVVPVASNLALPTAMAFSPDGRIFITEKAGIVKVAVNGQVLATPFIDLRAEVNARLDRGLLGIAVDPNFATNHFVYLLFTVDPIYGEPDEPGDQGTFGRLVRYAGTVESGGNVADPKSRTILIGATPAEGIPSCSDSHAVGSLRFGSDGSLFVSAGDGAGYAGADSGGQHPSCFAEGMFPASLNIGAFRAQSLDSLAGKVLRINPLTGQGLSDNPFFDGNPTSVRSRIWISGLRNPFRIAVRSTPQGPGTLYVGDVGWDTYEEINVMHGGDNGGWPCFEGNSPASIYPNLNPANSGCSTIGSPNNPGPLRSPLIWWHHTNGALTFPQGFIGICSIGGIFYEGSLYPPNYRNAYYFADFNHSWIRMIRVNEQNQFQTVASFAISADGPVDFAVHPITGDIHYVALIGGQVRRIRYMNCDLDGNGAIGSSDLGILLGSWGPCAGCIADLNGDGVVNAADLGALLGRWGPCP